MSRHLVLAAAALLVCSAACSRDVTAPEANAKLTGSVTKIDTLRGMIRPNGDDAVDANEVVLITDDGAAFKLLGPVAELLRDAGSAQIWVAGEFTAANEMQVYQYAFRSDDQPDCPTPIVRVIPEMGACQDGGLARNIRIPEQARFSQKR